MAEVNELLSIHSLVRESRFKDLHEPVSDMSAPKQSQIEKIVTFITESLYDGKPVGVSCNAGLGRTGTILACYLVSRGLDAYAAISRVRMKRPGSIETREQEDAVRTFARRLKK